MRFGVEDDAVIMYVLEDLHRTVRDRDNELDRLNEKLADREKEIAEFIAERVGVSVSEQPARPGEVPGFSLDSTLIETIGFSPRIKFWDGLSSYLESRQPPTSRTA